MEATSKLKRASVAIDTYQTQRRVNRLLVKPLGHHTKTTTFSCFAADNEVRQRVLIADPVMNICSNAWTITDLHHGNTAEGVAAVSISKR